MKYFTTNLRNTEYEELVSTGLKAILPIEN